MSHDRRRAWATLAILAATALTAPAARAQGVAVTQAEALYNQGKELIDQKKYKEACERFSASLKIDEAVNTRVALARCYELDGKTASAWGEYLMAAKKGAGTPAGQYAAEQAKGIEKKLVKVRLTLDAVPPDLTLKIDGQPFPKESLNADLPLDPGEHVVEVSAPKKRAWKQSVRLGTDAAAAAAVVKIALEDMSPEELAAEEKKGKTVIIEKSNEPKTEWTSTKTAGFVVGGAGAVAGLGAITTAILTVVFDANSSTSERNCSTTNRSACDDATSYHDRASSMQTVAIVSGISAAVLLGTGVTLVLVGGDKPAAGAPAEAPKAAFLGVAPLGGTSTAGAQLVGRF